MRRLHEAVVQQIVQQIVSGALQPGTALPSETQLTQQFGVSRMVIREAMRILVSKGLLTVKHGSGIWIQPPSNWDHLDPSILFELVRAGRDDGLLDELIEARRLLEPEAAALAAARRSEDDLEALRTSLCGMEAALTDPDTYTCLDIAFHDRILDAAHNRLLRKALRPIAEVLKAGRTLSIRQPGAAEKSLTGHREILQALEQSAAPAARDAMRRHILQFEADIHSALTSQTADQT